MPFKEDIIIITAAGPKTWLRERFTPSAWVRMMGENLLSGKGKDKKYYKQKMDTLRQVDDRIFTWLNELEGIAKQMRKASNGRRYVDVAIYLSQINRKLQDVTNAGKEVKKLTEEEERPFELTHKEKLPDQMFAMDGPDGTLISEAGWWGDLKREWVAKRMETEFRKNREIAVNKLVDDTEQLVLQVKQYLNELSKARASGDIGAYISILKDLSISQASFKKSFMPVYAKYLEPLIVKLREEQKAAEAEMAREEAEMRGVPETQPMGPAAVEKATQETKIQAPVSIIPEKDPITGKIPSEKQREMAAQEAREAAEIAAAEHKPEVIEVGSFPGSVKVKSEQPAPHSNKSNVLTDEQEKAIREMKIPSKKPTDIKYEQEGTATKRPHEMAPISEQPISIREEALPFVGKTLSEQAVPFVGKPTEKGLKELNRNIKKLKVEQSDTSLILLKLAHQNFINELVKASAADDPYLLAAMLLKYAEQIEEDDLQKSLELTAIAEGIIDG